MTEEGPGADLDVEEVATEARRLLDAECSADRVRRALASDEPFDRDLWRSMTGAGWPALCAPEEFGGLAAAPAVTASVLEELGSHCAGSPLAATWLAAWAVAAGGTPDQRARWLPGLAGGTTIAGVAVGGASGHVVDGGVEVRLETPAGRAAAGGRLTGTTGAVLAAAGADLLVVAAGLEGGGVGCVVVEAGDPHVEVVDEPSWDPTRATAVVHLDGLVIGPERRLEGPGLYGSLISRGAWMLACDSLGVAGRCLQMTTAHGIDRRQFGRQIGSFEAWKHRCADLFILVQEARMALRHANGLLAAAGGTQEDDPALDFAVSAAKFLAADNAVEVAGAAIQLHGAIGFTWEHDLHLLLKRALVNRALFGDSAYHRERAARALLPSPR